MKKTPETKDAALSASPAPAVPVEPVVKIRFRAGDMLTTEPETEGFTVYGARSVTIRAGDGYNVTSPEVGIERYVQERIRSALATPPAPAVGEECSCFGDSGLHASTYVPVGSDREHCDLCGRPVPEDSTDLLTAINQPGPAPAVGDGGLSEEDRNYLEEIADGAWGDDPRTRGLARDRLAASPATDIRKEKRPMLASVHNDETGECDGVYVESYGLKKLRTTVAEIERLQADNDVLRERATTAEGLLAKAREALKPFAELAEIICGEAPAEWDSVTLFRGYPGVDHKVSMEQLRAAVSTLQELEGRDNG